MKYKAKASEEMKSMLVEFLAHPEDAQSMREPEATYMVDRVREGLDFGEFHAFQEMLNVSEERLGGLLGMSRATLHRRKKSGQLDRSESDRLVRFARIFARVCEVFGRREAAAKWLVEPAFAFHGECPLDYADTEVGAREVEALIWRIENGIPT